jgi:hypothetical protein
MGMFAAYFDESGTHSASSALVVAGYLSPVSQWQRFDGEWADLLRDLGIESPFHMVDFSNGQGQFKGWPEAKRRNCVTQITGIIGRRTQFRASFSVSKRAYEEVIGETEIGPYGFCVWEWMKEAERWMDRYGVHEPIAYVFEGGSGCGGQILDNFQWMTKKRPDLKNRYRIGSQTFASKKNVLPLQAADVFAYEAWKHLVNVTLVEEKRPIRTSLKLLIGKSKHHAYHHGRQELEKLKRDLDSFVDPLEES